MNAHTVVFVLRCFQKSKNSWTLKTFGNETLSFHHYKPLDFFYLTYKKKTMDSKASRLSKVHYGISGIAAKKKIPRCLWKPHLPAAIVITQVLRGDKIVCTLEDLSVARWHNQISGKFISWRMT